MKRYNGADGSKVDEMEEANKSTEGMLSNPNAKEFGDSGTSETATVTTKTTPKAAPKAAPKPVAKAAPKAESKAAPADETKMSVSERLKMSRDRARSGSGATDTRSVSQRLRSAFGMKNGGSASSRADGIATKGKTRGKMC